MSALIVSPMNFECMLCGYVYDPARGDPDNDAPPGTPFAELPEDWRCPVCGADRTEFEPLVGSAASHAAAAPEADGGAKRRTRRRPC